jgi:hypothetical protein
MAQHNKPSAPSSRQASSPPHFIEAFTGVLSGAECEAIIQRFEQDPRRHPSRTATTDTPLVRSGTMLVLPRYPEWADICRRVSDITRACLDLYASRYPSLKFLAHPENCVINPPIMERIEPGQGYGYHIDAGPGGTHDRLVSGLIYLRDITEGGETEFPYQKLRVPPKAGTLMLFPPFWTHLHRGNSPAKQVKYNLTNYVVVRPVEPSSPVS